MIVVRYTGGLGNQMFEYAMSLMLIKKNPEEHVYADLTRYDMTIEHDGFDILKYFDVNIDIMSDDIKKIIAPLNYYLCKIGLKNFLYKIKVSKIEGLNNKLEKRDNRVGIIRDYASTNYNANAFNIDKIKSKIWHYKGNWINPLYWKDCVDYIRDSFIFKTDLLSKNDREIIDEMQHCESVSIHIRRGDYSGNYRYDLCNDFYYIKALEKIKSIVKDNKKIIYYVFSEEKISLPYIQNYKNIYHPELCGVDLWMMSKCKYNIIANSTFSYWAAILNVYDKKKVIAPYYAYRGDDMKIELPVPTEWIRINNLEQ